MGDLPQDILSRLDALASKLNTTTERLWPTLVAEERADGWVDIIRLGITVAIGAAAFVFAFHAVHAGIDGSACRELLHRYSSSVVECPVWPWVVGACATVVGLTCVVFALDYLDGFSRVMAPEGAALRRLIRSLRGND